MDYSHYFPHAHQVAVCINIGACKEQICNGAGGIFVQFLESEIWRSRKTSVQGYFDELSDCFQYKARSKDSKDTKSQNISPQSFLLLLPLVRILITSDLVLLVLADSRHER